MCTMKPTTKKSDKLQKNEATTTIAIAIREDNNTATTIRNSREYVVVISNVEDEVM